MEHKDSTLSIFQIFLRLGLTSFGGPIAHLAYFRREFVERRNWLTEHAYADLVALCQILPGPASSQVGISLGLRKGGLRGAAAAWLGFTLPSAILLIACGLGIAKLGDALQSGWIHGLKIVAVAVVAQAIWSMGRSLCPDPTRATFAVLGAGIMLAFPTALAQIGAIVCGGFLGFFLLGDVHNMPHTPSSMHLSRRAGFVALTLFVLLLILLPLIAQQTENIALLQFGRFYRSGALVFGGGHVVLPLLQAEVVPRGWISNDQFLAGYGLAQAAPGPLFTFAAYLGATSTVQPNGWIGGLLCLVAIFLPGFLITIGVLPFWERVRQNQSMQNILKGISAIVVGILISAFYNPVWTSTVHRGSDFALVLGAFLLLTYGKTPAWAVVLLCAAAGAVL